MSSALSITCLQQFHIFISFLTIGHIGPTHHALSWCMLYLTDRGMHNLDISIVHHLYWSTQFLFSSFYDLHIWLSQFYLVHNVNTPLQCLLILFHFILPTCQNYTMHFTITCYVIFQDCFA